MPDCPYGSRTSDIPQKYHVFISHCGDQKRNVADDVRYRFEKDQPQLSVFVADEPSLEPADNRTTDHTWRACKTAFVGEASRTILAAAAPRSVFLAIKAVQCRSCKYRHMCIVHTAETTGTSG
jgi:hypothetical protein